MTNTVRLSTARAQLAIAQACVKKFAEAVADAQHEVHMTENNPGVVCEFAAIAKNAAEWAQIYQQKADALEREIKHIEYSST